MPSASLSHVCKTPRLTNYDFDPRWVLETGKMKNMFIHTLLIISMLTVSESVLSDEYIEPIVDEEMRQTLREAMYDSYGFEDHIAAQVWLTDMSNRLKRTITDDKYRLQLLRTIHAEAARAELQPELVLSVIQVESNFDRFAISTAGARGLMQVMPFWIKEIGHPEDNLFIPEVNLRYGTTILKYYLDMENGQLDRALARYNGSVGKNRYPRLVFSALRNKWFEQ